MFSMYSDMDMNLDTNFDMNMCMYILRDDNNCAHDFYSYPIDYSNNII